MLAPAPVVQRRGPGRQGVDVGAAAARGVEGTGSALPFQSQIQTSFGRHDVGQVQAYSGTQAQGAAESIGAMAYATGDKVAFARSPDLFTAAHEAAHTVQQKSGVQLSGGVGQAGDRYEQHADEVAQAVVAGKSAEPILDRMSSGAGRASGRAIMRLEATPKTSGYLYVAFDEKGGWDAAEVLSHLSQNENTETVTPENLPGAGGSSDGKRCGSNTSLSVAIAGGPQQTMELCKQLRAKIEGALAQAGKAPGVPDAGVCAQARAHVTSVMINLYMGMKGGAHQGGGCTLQYQDLDKVAHYLYVFSYDPKDAVRNGPDAATAGQSAYRTSDEVAEQAKMAGYKQGDKLRGLADAAELDEKVEALGKGESLMVGYRVHFINFFRNAKDGVIYCYDGWGAKTTMAKGTPEYEAVVAKVFSEGAKPQAFTGKAPNLEGKWLDPIFAPGGLELSH